MSECLFVHRGRNAKSDFLGGLISDEDFIFDYRGRHTLVMLWRAFLAAWRLPSSKAYFVEGALCLWPVVFKKLFLFSRGKIIMMIPEPAFNWRTRSFYANCVLKFFFNFVDFFLPISDLVARDLKFYSSKPFAILHHFSDLDLNLASNSKSNYKDKNILFIINRPEETGFTKGLDIVLSIFKELLSRDHGWQLFMIGSGTEKLMGVWRELASSGSVHLEGHQNPLGYFARCPYLLAPARYDAFPLAVVEAASSGCLPIISSTTGSEEFVKEIDPGLVINSFSAHAYVSEIENLYNSSRAEINLRTNGLRAKSSVFTKNLSRSELQSAIEKINSLLGLKILLK